MSKEEIKINVEINDETIKNISRNLIDLSTKLENLKNREKENTPFQTELINNVALLVRSGVLSSEEGKASLLQEKICVDPTNLKMSVEVRNRLKDLKYKEAFGIIGSLDDNGEIEAAIYNPLGE